MAISSFLSVIKRDASGKKESHGDLARRQQHGKLQTSSEIKRGVLVVPISQQKGRIRKKSHTATWLVSQQHRKLQTSSEIKRGDLVVPICQKKRRIRKKRVTRRLGSSANNTVSYKLPPRSSVAFSSFLSVNKRDASGRRVTRRLGSSANNIVSYKLPPIKRGDLVVPICQQQRRIRKKSHTATWLVRQQHRKLQTSSEMKRGVLVVPICQQERRIRKKRVRRRLGSSANNIVSYKLPPRSSVAISSYLPSRST